MSPLLFIYIIASIVCSIDVYIGVEQPVAAEVGLLRFPPPPAVSYPAFEGVCGVCAIIRFRLRNAPHLLLLCVGQIMCV